MTHRLPLPNPATFTQAQWSAHARLTELRRATARDKAREGVYAALADDRAARVEGPSGLLLHSPSLPHLVSGLGLALRHDGTLPTRAMEIAILTVAAAWKADYAFANHDAYAAKAGVPQAVIDALREGREPALTDAKDRIAWRVARAMLDHRRVPDDLQAEARAVLGDRGAIELVTLVGYYGMLCGLCATFDIEVPGGRRVF